MLFKTAKHISTLNITAMNSAQQAIKGLKPDQKFTIEQSHVIRTAFENLKTARTNLDNYIGKNFFKKFICFIFGARLSKVDAQIQKVKPFNQKAESDAAPKPTAEPKPEEPPQTKKMTNKEAPKSEDITLPEEASECEETETEEAPSEENRSPTETSQPEEAPQHEEMTSKEAPRPQDIPLPKDASEWEETETEEAPLEEYRSPTETAKPEETPLTEDVTPTEATLENETISASNNSKEVEEKTKKLLEQRYAAITRKHSLFYHIEIEEQKNLQKEHDDVVQNISQIDSQIELLQKKQETSNVTVKATVPTKKTSNLFSKIRKFFS